MLSLFRRLVLRKTARRRRAIEGLLAPDLFAEQLAKERARTDRGAGAFSVLVLHVAVPSDSDGYLQAAWVLSALLNQRTRFTDTKGWFGDSIAVIFPHTPADKVAHIWPPIKEAFDQRVRSSSTERLALPEVTYEVLAYPGDQLDVPGQE